MQIRYDYIVAQEICKSNEEDKRWLLGTRKQQVFGVSKILYMKSQVYPVYGMWIPMNAQPQES